MNLNEIGLFLDTLARLSSARIVVRMAVPAFKQAMEIFAAAPQPPADLAAPGFSKRQNILRLANKFADDVAQWRAGMIQVRQGLTDIFRDTLEIAPKEMGIRIRGLDEFIEQVDRNIEDERRVIDESELGDRQVVATLKKSSSDNAHFLRKVLKKMREAAILQHNTRVDFYRFLLALRADYNPEYSGGPTFDNAEDLINDLRNQTR